jgi:streptogramin lyase
MHRVRVAVLAAVLGWMLAGCSGLSSHAFDPATSGHTGTSSRRADPNILQQNDGAQFVEFSSGCSSLGQLSHDVTGVSMWFTEPDGCRPGHGAVGSIAIATGAITQYALPRPNAVTVTSMTAGPDGNVWFVGTYVRRGSESRRILVRPAYSHSLASDTRSRCPE